MTIGGLVGLATPWLWPAGNARRALLVAGLMVVSVLAEYTAYLVFPIEEWTYLRFLLPIWPLLAVGTAAIAATLLERATRCMTIAALLAAVIGIGVIGVRTARDRSTF